MSEVARGLAKLRGVRSAMLPDPAKVTDAESFNRVLDSCVRTIENLRLDEAPVENVVTEAPKKKKRNKVKIDLGRDRMEHGGTEREAGEE